jgi:hypothetical protein
MGASAARRMSEYSQEPITLAHLERLSKMAAHDNRFLTRDGSNWTDYRGRPVLVVLAQGAAQHYVAVQTGHGQAKGVKDLDVWSFFAGVGGRDGPSPPPEPPVFGLPPISVPVLGPPRAPAPAG